ncbi:hypothetical protein NIA69_09145 [Gemmiger formicilis]|nr:hypothetical protein [Gemmiger formicilis]
MYDTVTVPAEEDTGGGEEFRNAIWPLYTTGSSAKLWNGRFEAPARALSPWSTVSPRWWTASAAARPPA